MQWSGVEHPRRAIEAQIQRYAESALNDPLSRFSVALLTGSPLLDIGTFLAQRVAPGLVGLGTEQQQVAAQCRGVWSETAPLQFCLAEAEVPAAPPVPGSPVRLLLIACSNASALPAWLHELGSYQVRTLPIGPLSLIEAQDGIEAQLGGHTHPDSTHTLASLAGRLPRPFSTLIDECRSTGALQFLDDAWRLVADPIHAAMVPYLRAQLETVSPRIATEMFQLALLEPFSLSELRPELTETVQELLLTGELEYREDGRYGFSAPAAALALRQLAPADEQRLAHTASLRSETPTFQAVRWAAHHRTPVTAKQLQHVADTAGSRCDWQGLVDVAELAERIAAEYGSVAPATRCTMHLQAAFARRFLPEPELAYEHLDRAEQLLTKITGDGVDTDERSELLRSLRLVRAGVSLYREGDVEASVQSLTVAPHDPDEAEALGYTFVHLVHGGQFRDAEQLLARLDTAAFRGPNRLRDRVDAAETLLLTATGAPSSGVRKATQATTRTRQTSGHHPLIDEELRSAYVIAALSSDGPAAFPSLEKHLDEHRAITGRPDLTHFYFLHGTWELARGNVTGAHRLAQLALHAAHTADPTGLLAAATALAAETAALIGEQATAFTLTSRYAHEPLRASAAIAGRLEAHVSAAQLLCRMPHQGEKLRRTAEQFVQHAQYGHAAETLYSGVRFGRRRAARDLCALTERVEGNLHDMRVSHAAALLADDPVAMIDVMQRLQDAGLMLHAAEAAAATLHMSHVPDSLRNRAAAQVVSFLSDQPLAGHAFLRDSGVPAGGTKLTPREREVLQLIDSRLSNAEIADRLGLSLTTVEGHITRIYRKTGGRRRAPVRR